MSLKSFYQTFYQHEQLYRLPGESFAPIAFRAVEVAALPGSVKTPGHAWQTEEEPVPALVASPVAPTPTLPAPIPITEPVAPPVEVVLPIVVVPTDLPQRPIVLPAPVPVMPVAPPKIKHKVLLLADEDLDPSSLLFLEKVLNAVNLDITGVDLLNLHGAGDIDFADLLRGKHIHHFITFGVPFERVGLDIMMDRYQPVRFEGITFLIVDALPVIEANQKLKRSLWEALKRIFA